MKIDLSEQEIVRRQALEQLQELKINPYPAAEYPVNAYSTEIKAKYETDPECTGEVCLAGRMMSKRLMGKAAFLVVQDSHGRLQVYLKQEEISPGEDKSLFDNVIAKILDIGDFIGVKGYMFKTKTGEITLHAREFVFLSKSLKPLPIVKEKDGVLYDAFTDPELRYRQRYVDLIVNPQVRDIFIKRQTLVQSMRQFMISHGYLEVETPVLQPLYGGAAARPFVTHHHTLDKKFYLRIANELYLKRLIVGGYDGVFEFAKDFRNEGMSRFHNPEFTMMELYVAYKDYKWMMDFTEAMLENAAIALQGSTEIRVGEHIISFKRPWKRYTMFESIRIFTGVDIDSLDEQALRQVCRDLKVPVEPAMALGKLIDAIFGEHVEPHLIQPTFITDYPVEMSPLAKRKADNPAFVERFEAICNSKEICNAFSELNDPIDQRARFEEQVALGIRGDEEAMTMDEDFLRALEYGMPPTAGIGIGIDRLAMIMTNQPSIQEVIFFPQMRDEN